jgi:D-alanyl-D-alanine carboxypeptidase
MNRIKYLVILSLIVIISALIVKNISQNDNMKQRAQDSESFVPVTSSVVSGVRMIEEDILLDDHEKPIAKPSVLPNPKPITKPYITAESYIVGNLKTGEIYLQLNSDKVAPIASVSKLYTALVVKHVFDQEKEISITQTMLDAYGESGGLRLDERFKPEELLYALLLVSSNDAAEAFAQSFGFEEFMSNMNGFAKEIGMHKTYFSDPSGLSPQNISNASDLFALAKYLYSSEKNILDISKTVEFNIATTTEHGSHHYVNINPFTAYSYFSGGKTGRTNEAKEAMVSIFDQTVGDTTYPIAVIVLRSDLGEREMNTEKLLGLFMDKVSGK